MGYSFVVGLLDPPSCFGVLFGGVPIPRQKIEKFLGHVAPLNNIPNSGLDRVLFSILHSYSCNLNYLLAILFLLFYTRHGVGVTMPRHSHWSGSPTSVRF